VHRDYVAVGRCGERRRTQLSGAEPVQLRIRQVGRTSRAARRVLAGEGRRPNGAGWLGMLDQAIVRRVGPRVRTPFVSGP
jgi:hypothetical protein